MKQSGREWYNRFNEYLIEKGFENNEICPCIFNKKTTSGFDVVVVYVDDLNLVGTPKELIKIIASLKDEFDMKDLQKKFFYLGLQIEHLLNGKFIHQSTYKEKVLKYFYMDNVHPLSIPMVVRSLNAKKTIFYH